MKVTRKRELLLIVLAYCFAGVLYALMTPPMESSDEYKHFPVVQYVQRNRQLPVLYPADPGRWQQEAAQPPLYYILMALVTFPIDTSDLPGVHLVNPHAFVGDPNQVATKTSLFTSLKKKLFPGRDRSRQFI